MKAVITYGHLLHSKMEKYIYIPIGSEESVIMTSNSFMWSSKNLTPSWTWTVTLGEDRAPEREGKYFLLSSITRYKNNKV